MTGLYNSSLLLEEGSKQRKANVLKLRVQIAVKLNIWENLSTT